MAKRKVARKNLSGLSGKTAAKELPKSEEEQHKRNRHILHWQEIRQPRHVPANTRHL